MKLPRYPKYKDSGVKWLGQVPEHWEIKRLKRCVRLVTKRATEQTNPIALENLESWTGKYVPSDATYEAEGIAFGAGDILFGKLRPYLAKAYLATTAGEAVGDFFVMRPNKSVRSDFLKHFILTKNSIDIIDGSTYGAKMPRASWDFLGGIPIPVPSSDEQESISEFVRIETAKIDELILEQQQLIELLTEKRHAVTSQAVTKGLDPDAPMKPSGVKWLDEVPAHWEVYRLTTLYREIIEAGNDELPILSVSIHSGVSDRQLDEDEMDRKVNRSEDTAKYKKVLPGDLVYNMMRAWQGGFGTVTVPGQISPAYVVACPKSDFHTRFIELLLRTPQAIEEIRCNSYGVTDFRLRLYWDNFKIIRVALPPKEEQEKILARIEKMHQKFDQLIEASNSSIASLQERRSVLISAAVTGQIDVRNYYPEEVATVCQ
ncbi:MAG TPA: restriction endonuclease subunit S [Acidisarcina sp.]|nr:restriction endonuclease subunit S [Acidisarcina sp.]